jgi:hypothetical protein
MGRSFANVDDAVIRNLVEIFISKGWYASAVCILTFGVEEDKRFEDIFAKIILDSNFISTPMEDIHEWSLFEVCRRIIKYGNIEFSVVVANKIMDIALSNAGFIAQRRVSDLWPDLLAHDEVWSEICERYRNLEVRRRWKLLINFQYLPHGGVGHQLALEVVSIDKLIAFASEHVESVPKFLAQYGKMVEIKEDRKLGISKLMPILLENFGERDDVLRCITANLHSFLSVGSRASYYEERAKIVDDIPTFGITKIAAWKEDLRIGFTAERRKSEVHDEEFNEGIWN